MYVSVNLGYASENIRQLKLLKELFVLGAFSATIDRTYTMAGIVEVHRYVNTERKKNNCYTNRCE